MSIRDGKNLSTWEGGFFDRNNPDSVSLLYRLLWLFTKMRGEGWKVELNEAGRPEGVPGDIAIGRAGRSSDETESGVSTVNYQYGRYLLWLDTGGTRGTPSAVKPGGVPSRHQFGTAADIDSNNYARLYQLAAQVGMAPTILPSERWHLDKVGEPRIPASEFEQFTAVVDAVFGRTPSRPTPPPVPTDWLDMATREEVKQAQIEAIRETQQKPAHPFRWIVFGAQFASGDEPLKTGLGQATKENSPEGSDWGNYYDITLDDTYSWKVTPGNINEACIRDGLVDAAGNPDWSKIPRVDRASFFGKRNAFSRDAL